MLAFSPFRKIVRRAQPGETALLAYLRQAALWCADMPGRSPDTIAAFLDRIPDIEPALVEEGRYFVADNGREILGGAGWSPLGPDVRAWLFGEHNRASHPDCGGEAVLIRGFFLQDRSGLRVGLSLMAEVQAEAMRAGFGSAEVIAPVALQDSFLSMGFRVHCRLEFGAGEEPVQLVHMRKAFTTALSEAA